VAAFCGKRKRAYKMRAAIVAAETLDAEAAAKITPVGDLLASVSAAAKP
jgi:hypothetical protein